MTSRLTPAAITLHCDGDHTLRRRNARAHVYITPHGLEYRSTVDHSNDR